MSIEDTMITTTDPTAQARKRRKVHLSKQRSADDVSSIASSSVAGDSTYYDSSSDDHPKKPSIRGIKRQARYDPGVPMNREELKAWRKEARRVRNRESAAASRKRTRDRIEELEGQLQALENKYSAALQRIAELEADKMMTSTPEDLLVSTVSPSASPNLTPTSLASPPRHFVLATDEPMSLPSSSTSPSSSFQHVMDPRTNA